MFQCDERKQRVYLTLLQHLVKAGIAVSEDVAKQLENFVCKLYGYKESNINNVRKKIVEKKCKKEGKIVDLANLPPCRSVLKLHILRAYYVAKVWNVQLEKMVVLNG